MSGENFSPVGLPFVGRNGLPSVPWEMSGENFAPVVLSFVGKHWETFGSRTSLSKFRKTFCTRLFLGNAGRHMALICVLRNVGRHFAPVHPTGDVGRNSHPSSSRRCRETFGTRPNVGRKMSPRMKLSTKKFGGANFIKHDDGDIAAVVIKEVNHVERNKKGGWYIDTGVTAHVCAGRSKFYTYKTVEERKLNMGNQASSEDVGVGDMVLKMTSEMTITPKEVLHVRTYART